MALAGRSAGRGRVRALGAALAGVVLAGALAAGAAPGGAEPGPLTLSTTWAPVGTEVTATGACVPGDAPTVEWLHVAERPAVYYRHPVPADQVAIADDGTVTALLTVPETYLYAGLWPVLAPTRVGLGYQFRVGLRCQPDFGLATSAEVLTVSPAPFAGVPEGRPFHDEIAWMGQHGYATGTFDPTGVVTRGAMTAFLYRLDGSMPLEEDIAQYGFSDVPPGHPFHDTVEWARWGRQDRGVRALTEGYADGTFRPAEPMTRAATAAFLYRLSNGRFPTMPDPADPSRFSDVDRENDTHGMAIEWLAMTGVIDGYADGTFRPGELITRQAMAKLLHRFAHHVTWV